MESNIRKIAVLTSGGDAPGMNAAIRAVVRTGVYYGLDVYGIYRGYDGLIENDIKQLTARSVKNILERGGTMLKSARSMEFKTREGRKKAFENLKRKEIDAIVAIGGDGTFTGANIFADEFGVKVIGIPGTIDNDLSGSDFTIGFDTATNTAIDCLDKIRDTAMSHNRLFFVEVMGRDAGFIAVHTAIGSGAVAVIIPERDWTLDQLIHRLDKGIESKKTSSIVIVAEGGKLGNVNTLAHQVMDRFPYYDVRVTILGHIQRGGNPTQSDRVLASRLGVASVEALLEGKSKVMVGVINHQIVYTDLMQAIKEKYHLDKDLIRIADILST